MRRIEARIWGKCVLNSLRTFVIQLIHNYKNAFTLCFAIFKVTMRILIYLNLLSAL